MKFFKLTILLAVLLVSAFAMAQQIQSVTVDDTPGAAGDFTAGIQPNSYGTVNISVQGATWSATVTVQRRFRLSVSSWGDWQDVDNGSFTANTEKTIYSPSGTTMQYRIGVKQADYSSGSVLCIIAN